MSLEQYQAILKAPVEPEVVKALHQPERHILVSFKVFAALLARIELLEQPVKETVNRLVDARVKEVTAELEKTWNERLLTARIRGARPIEVGQPQSTVPAIAPRDREAQG